MKSLKIIFILTLLSGKILAQEITDTLYLFPDTTTFLNEGIFVIEDIANYAIEYTPEYDWNNYTLEKILVQFHQLNSAEDTIYIYFQISTGIIPNDSLIGGNLSRKFAPKVFFPAWEEIKIEPSIELNNLNNFYITGDVMFTSARSYYQDEMISNYYLYNQSRNEWREGTFCHFAVKIVIKKNLTSVDDEKIVNRFQLKQNFPNPFNSSTKINFSLEKGGLVELKIYDLLGKERVQLINDYKEGGEHSVDFNAIDLNSGCYFYTLLVDGMPVTRKMMYLK